MTRKYIPVLAGHMVAITVLILVVAAVSPVKAEPLPDYNNIFIHVANDAGAKYNPFYNDTYNIRFEGYDRGLNALHVSTDPAVNFGQVTETNEQTGTFYATDSGGKGYEDEILLMVAVNGTIPDDFGLRVTADGYTWTPNPERNQPPPLESVIYQSVALDETFSKADFIYGPQIWKPTGNGFDYPVYAGQSMTDTANTFQLMFVDLNAGVLRPDVTLENMGAVRISYALQNLESFAAFSVYGYCQNSNNGDDMVAWTNALLEPKVISGYSVIGQPSAILTVPGQTRTPTDPDLDGRYEDTNGNGDPDFDDVVVFFKNIEWIIENEPDAAFDFNGSGSVGFEDVVQLFKEM
jgi:PKD repeat protein